MESLVIEYDNPGRSAVPPPLPAKNSSAAIKREVEEKYTASTDDLTCNLCGREYEQWTHLKKHLLDHILIAQNSAEGKSKVSQIQVPSFVFILIQIVPKLHICTQNRKQLKDKVHYE